MDSILAQWTGDGFAPARRHYKALDAELVVGEQYVLEIQQTRNMGAHRAYFAQVKEIWKTLPEDLAEQFPSDTHLRKYALVKTGFCTETKTVFTTPKDAILGAAFAAAAADYAVVAAEGRVVRVWKPESQAVNKMGGKRFRESMDKVLDFLAGMIAVSREELARAAETAEAA